MAKYGNYANKIILAENSKFNTHDWHTDLSGDFLITIFNILLQL